MSISIRRAAADDTHEIQAFNQRLIDGNIEFQLPDPRDSICLSPSKSVPVWHELFVAREPTAIRGGYLLKREPLRIGQERKDVGYYYSPLSEGILNRRYATLGIQLLQHAMKQAALLYCLGMGNLKRPLPRLLMKFGWSVEEVPFLFRIIHGSTFFRNITYLKDLKFGAALAALIGYSGAGSIGALGWQLVARIRRPQLPRGLTVAEIDTFPTDMDSLFFDVQNRYGALIERTAAVLNIRYPPTDPRLIRLIVHNHGTLLGWVVLSRSSLHAHKQFGSMKLGCIVDGVCDPDVSPILIRLATDRLIAENVDLLVSNQTHSSWIAGLRRCGFAQGPSNFIFARSPALAMSTPQLAEWHMNRGDGDGPIHL